MKISFHSNANKTYFHMKSFALSLAFIVGLTATRKWPTDFPGFILIPGLKGFEIISSGSGKDVRKISFLLNGQLQETVWQ